LGIYDSGDLENGIHGMPYLADGLQVSWRVGEPGSFGCIVLKGNEMAELYRWAPFGTLVVIRS
jgi:hypothetical protein